MYGTNEEDQINGAMRGAWTNVVVASLNSAATSKLLLICFSPASLGTTRYTSLVQVSEKKNFRRTMNFIEFAYLYGTIYQEVIGIAIKKAGSDGVG